MCSENEKETVFETETTEENTNHSETAIPPANEEWLANFRSYLRRKELFTLGNRISAAFIFTMLIMTLWSYAVFGIARISGADIRALYFFLEREENSNISQVILSVLAFTVPFFILSKRLRLNSDELCYKKPQKGKIFTSYFIGIGICSFSNIGVSIAGILLQSLGINYTVKTELSLPSGFFGSALYIITVSVIPALVEEYALRGVTLGALKKYGTGFALIVSSLFFGLMHSNFEQIPFTFICGLGMGYAALASGSVWTAVLIHFTNNFESVLLELSGKYVSSYTQNMIYFLFSILAMGLGIFAVVKADKKGILIPENTDNSGLTSKQKIKSFFISPIFIIYFITIIYIACTVYGGFS